MLEPSIYLVLVPITAVAGFIRGFAGFMRSTQRSLPALNVWSYAAAASQRLCGSICLPTCFYCPRSGGCAARGRRPANIGTLATMPVGVLLRGRRPCVQEARYQRQLVAALVLLSGWRYLGAIGPIGWAGGSATGTVTALHPSPSLAALFPNAGSQTAREPQISSSGCSPPPRASCHARLRHRNRSESSARDWRPCPLSCGYALLGTRSNKRAPEAQWRAVLLLVVAIATAGLLV